MSTIAKINLKPGLYISALVIVAVLLAVLVLVVTASKAKDGQKVTETFAPELSIQPLDAGTTEALTGDFEGFCGGHESLCSTSTTGKPAELLAKLAAALPESEAARYRVKVSVVPLDE